MIEEGHLIPFSASAPAPGPWLVFAPHADDETFGMGGSIALAASRGDDVTVVVLTDGARGLGAEESAGVATREAEAQAAARVLGIERLDFWRSPDRGLRADPERIAQVASAVQEHRPAAVFFPSPLEHHPDHRACALLVWEGLNLASVPVERIAYEISVQGPVNRLIDISSVLDAKRAAMACYASQLAQNDYADLVLALNRTRTYTLPAGVSHAEGQYSFGCDAQGPLAAHLQARLRPYWAVSYQDRPPLVSIILRTKDRPDRLRKALDSLLAQTYPALEAVVVNDGGLDIQDLFHAYADRLAGFRLLNLEQSIGRTRAANRGLDAATGRYIGFLDDDDWFLPDHLERLVAALEQSEIAGVAYGGVDCVEEDGQGGTKPVHRFDQSFESAYLRLRNFIPMHAALFRREFVDAGLRLDETLDLYEDWDFWVQLAERTEFRHVPGVSALYLVAQGSGFGVSADQARVVRAQDAFFEKWRQRWQPERLREIVDYGRQVPELRQLAHDRGMECNHLEQEEARWRSRALELEPRAREAERLGVELARVTEERNDLQQSLAAREGELAETTDRAQQLQGQVERLAGRLQDLEQSTSWRITEPLRNLIIRVRAVRTGLSTQVARNRRRVENLAWAFRRGGVSGVRDHLRRRREFLRQLQAPPPAPANEPARQDGPTPPSMIEVVPGRIAAVARDLRLPPADAPEVTVVIPVYNQLAYTLACLASICRNPPQVSFEVVVVDDASSDDTHRILAHIAHLRYLRNDRNLGFVRTCNHGAGAARGNFLLFLNNDTQVLPGWMDSLLEVFRSRADAGIVGAKLIYPSGYLQEAGATLRRDGSVDLVGLNGNPQDPRYNFLREVDHCSGAAMLIETALFRELNGFDEIYAPSYFEDCDLSLRVRQAGRKVYYQPASEVVHHLSVTTDGMPEGKMAQIERNRETYLRRWGEVLEELDQVRLITFFLPQYHPIPENDEWWGKGFTEWTNVTKAKPNFEGHYQPHLPSDLGFYDLRLGDVREEQARMAREYGVYGFCYYYYWFGGKRLLDRPLAEVLESGEPHFPFCVCWANENWTRRWDGRDSEILVAQDYSEEQDRRFIQDLLPAFRDPRYIRVDGRPLLLVYRADLLPDIRSTLVRWREECRSADLGEIYVATVESFSGMDNPTEAGFDAVVEFPPHGKAVVADPPPRLTNPHFIGNFYDYEKTAANFMHRAAGTQTVFRSAMPAWDNTARRQDTADIFVNTSPEAYRRWLSHLVSETRTLRPPGERIVFVNAWNEWAEGNHLEPDRKHGPAYLEATRAALGDLGCYDPPVADR